MVSFEATKLIADLGNDAAYWRGVAAGQTATEDGKTLTGWSGRIPADMRAATHGQLETLMAAGQRYQDVMTTISLADANMIRVVVTATPIP